MAIIASGKETYLLLTGVHTDTAVKLGPHTELLPATCHLNYDEFANMMKESYVDFAVGLLVIPLVRSQLHVTAESPKQLAVHAWNAQWDCLLLSALFDQTVLWNVQSDVPAEMIGPSTAINISNYHLSGFHIKGEWKLTTADKEWLESSLENIVSNGANLILAVEDMNGLSFPTIKYAQKISQPPADPDLRQKYFRLRRILCEFRSHSRGTLARYKKKIEHERILKNEIGRSVLNKLLDDQILSLQGSHYILDPDGLNAHLGVTWPDLRKGEMPESLFNYLREID